MALIPPMPDEIAQGIADWAERPYDMDLPRIRAAPSGLELNLDGEPADIDWEDYRGNQPLLKARFRQLSRKHINSFTFNLRDIDYDVRRILNYIPVTGQRKIILEAGNQYLVLNRANSRRVMTELEGALIDHYTGQQEELTWSQESFLEPLLGDGMVRVFSSASREWRSQEEIERRGRRRGRRAGAWFNYAHLIEGLDLEKLQIYHKDVIQTNEDPCIAYALEQSGAPIEMVKELKALVAKNANSFPMTKLKRVCEKFKVELQILTIRKDERKGALRYTKQKTVYPRSKTGYIAKHTICLYADHYFAYIEDTKVSKWALNNPDKAKLKVKNTDTPWWSALDRKNHKCMDSFNLVKHLLSLTRGDSHIYLKELNRCEQTARIQHYLKLQHEFDDLTFSEDFVAPYGVRPREDETVAEACDRFMERAAKKQSGSVEGKRKNPRMFFAFDFETTTDGKVHVPYMASVQRMPEPQFDLKIDDIKLADERHKVVTFTGPDCGRALLQYVCTTWAKEKNNYRPGVQLIAHNAGYDLCFLFKYFDHDFTPTLITGGPGRLKSCLAKYTYRTSHRKSGLKNKKRKYGFSSPDSCFIKIHDSLNFTMCRLSSFPKMFNLGQVEKEIMPYSLMTNSLINADSRHPTYGCLKLSQVLDSLAVQFYNNPKHLYAARLQYQGCTDEDVKQACLKYLEKFQSNVTSWGCDLTWEDEQYVDLIKYSKVYCERDVEILCKGYVKLRHMFHTVTNGLNIDYFVSVNHLTNKALQNAGCTEGVYELAGVPRDFIQHCITGGKCMLRNNEKQEVKGQVVADFDAVSLYPSAMAEMPGLLKGAPKIIPEGATYADLEELIEGGKKGAWFAKVRITKIGKNWQMPICNYYDYKENKREFTNDMVGKEMFCSSVTGQDMVKMQGVEFDIIQGYYFDCGYNTKLKDFITNIFNERLKFKKVKNPMQLVYKLMMNGCYGRLILKPIETESQFLPRSRTDFGAYLEKYWDLIKEFEIMPAGSPFSHRVTRFKEIYKHWSAPHLGVMVLDHSKRIMNRLHNIAHENNIPIFYMDTDSMHLLDEDVKRMAALFKSKYPHINKGELIGKQLGQFHNDFDINAIGPVQLPKFDGKKIRSTGFVAYGKKCYVHSLEVPTDENAEEKLQGIAIAMKGFTENSVFDVCNKNDLSMQELYQNVYDGRTYEADLLAGNKVSFTYSKALDVSSRSCMTRTMRTLLI